ncbi:MAG: malto-oligosyltrehalose synthase, partial [Reyranellaceae bacterium]
EADEELPPWPGIQGTTGYEALNLLTRLFLDEAGLDLLDQLWRKVCRGADSATMRADSKRQILRELFAGGLADLVRRLHSFDGRFAPSALEAALVEFLVRLPVYRAYVDSRGASASDRRVIESATDEKGASAFLREAAREPSEFTARLQQFSGPVMAKAVEDTLYYRDFRMLALNEVGGGPNLRPLTAQSFHAAVLRRQERQPHGMIATATHDTKRGEDARLRIAALTFMVEEWQKAVSTFPSDPVVAPEHRYMLWQSMLGAWPLDDVDEAFSARIRTFAVKAVREGKQRSGWTAPDRGYEEAVENYVERLLTGSESERFRRCFVPVAERAGRLGAALSLVQLALKATLPGLPDFYQGCEFWDLSLVDPDNRRAVDFSRRSAALEASCDWTELARRWRDGGIKMRVTNEVLRLRQNHSEMFRSGRYRPLTPAIPEDVRTIAFAREHGGVGIVVAACRDPSPFASRDWFDFSAWEPDFVEVEKRKLAPLIASPELPFAVWQADMPPEPQ